MPDLMDNYANHTILDGFSISAIFFGATVIETNHRILHSVCRLYRNRYRVRVRNRMFRVFP
ncbi:hypothetical protein D3C87_2001100 [compost metagenome]